MRIAVHDYAGFQFPLDLSIELSQRGHNVLHLFSQTSGGPKASFDDECHQHLEIANVGIDSVDKDNYFKRWVQERRYGDLVVRELNQWLPDIIVSGNTPLEAQKTIINWAGRCSVPSIFWLQDLLSIAAKSIISRMGWLLGRIAYEYLNRIEKGALNIANHIVAITEDFLPHLKRWEIDTRKVSIVPNWGPIHRIPLLPKNNSFSEHHGLNDKFVILYCGTLGKKQEVKLILDTASGLVHDSRYLFVVATDDRGKGLLNRQLTGNRLPNLLQLPLQPMHLYPYLLASSDACLVTLQASAGTYCVPSKLWSIYCAKKPSIVSVDAANMAAKITERIDAGIVIPTGSSKACITAIKQLMTHPGHSIRMGNNARRYAEGHFTINGIADEFESIIQNITVNDRRFRRRITGP